MCKFLRFASESESEAKTFLAEHVQDDQWITASHEHTLDPVGTIYDTTDPENPVPLPGWHLNYIGSKDVSAFEVFPITPSRVFQ